MYNPDEACRTMVTTLKKLCEQKGMSPYALAKKSGISTSTISYILNGKTKPQVYTILMLCNVLQVTISELFDEKCAAVKSEEIERNVLCCTICEEELLRCYRQMSAKKRGLLQVYIDMLERYDDSLLQISE